MMDIPPFPRKIRTQAIFGKITKHKPEMNCVLRWKVARIVYESIDQHWPCPNSLRYRLENMTRAAALLKEHGLPENMGNLRDHAFATCLRAYNWLELVRVKAHKPRSVDVTPAQVQAFAAMMGFHYNEFRRLGATSYVCQGSVFGAMSPEMLDSFIDHLKSEHQ